MIFAQKHDVLGDLKKIVYSVFSLRQLAPDYQCLVSPKPNNMGNELLCITWDSWRRGALCPFKKGMDMRLCALSELQPRKLHFAFQNYFGADFTVPSLPAGGTHSTSFSSCCLQPQSHARKVGLSVHEFQPLPQFQLPAILAKEGLDLQLAGKSLPAISAASEPFGVFSSGFVSSLSPIGCCLKEERVM